MKAHPEHQVLGRNANRVTILTDDPNGIVAMLSEPKAPPIESVEYNGKNVPLYFSAASSNVPESFGREDYAREARYQFYRLLHLLPEGLYELENTESGMPATMFVSVDRDSNRFDSFRSLRIDLELWEGQHLINPRTINSVEHPSIAHF